MLLRFCSTQDIFVIVSEDNDEFAKIVSVTKDHYYAHVPRSAYELYMFEELPDDLIMVVDEFEDHSPRHVNGIRVFYLCRLDRRRWERVDSLLKARIISMNMVDN